MHDFHTFAVPPIKYDCSPGWRRSTYDTTVVLIVHVDCGFNALGQRGHVYSYTRVNAVAEKRSTPTLGHELRSSLEYSSSIVFSVAPGPVLHR